MGWKGASFLVEGPRLLTHIPCQGDKEGRNIYFSVLSESDAAYKVNKATDTGITRYIDEMRKVATRYPLARPHLVPAFSSPAGLAFATHAARLQRHCDGCRL